MNPVAVRRALYGRLAGDTTLNTLLASPPDGWAKSIFYGHAPDQVEDYPFVLFSRQSNIPTWANDSTPAFENDIWWVRAIDQNTTADPAETIADRLDDLLNDATLSIAGGDSVAWLRRQSFNTYHETTDGVTYVHSGGLYRLVTEPA